MIRLSALSLVMLIVAACSGTGPQAPVPAGDSGTTSESVSDSELQAELSSSGEDGLICRREKTIGSRIGNRVCRTPEEDQAAREADQAGRAAAQEALERNAIRMDESRIVNE